MNTELMKAVERLERLIPELEYSRETHVQWRDCDQSCRDANPEIGDAKFHAGAVDAYDERMAAISQAAKYLRDLEAENARLRDRLREEESNATEIAKRLERLRGAMRKLENSESAALVKSAIAESRLAAADALLRRTRAKDYDAAGQLQLSADIDAYLQGAGDEH